jgi:hypothetical protein
MFTQLTPEILLSHGFVELEEKDVIGRPIYSLSTPKTPYGTYPFDIQVVINPQYGESNANSGIVSIFMKEETLSTIPDDLIYKEEWTDEDMKRADEHTTVFEATTQPIAWHVTTYERLKTIIEPLTLTTLEYGK